MAIRNTHVRDVALAAKLVAILEDLHKAILCKGIGRLLVMEHDQQQPIHPLLLIADQRIKIVQLRRDASVPRPAPRRLQRVRWSAPCRHSYRRFLGLAVYTYCKFDQRSCKVAARAARALLLSTQSEGFCYGFVRLANRPVLVRESTRSQRRYGDAAAVYAASALARRYDPLPPARSCCGALVAP